MRILLWALWSALLFIPFKGVVPGLIVFASVAAIGFAIGPSLKAISGMPKVRAMLPKVSPAVYFPFLLVALIVLPFATNDYITDIAVLAGIYAILALGLNVVVGFAGLLNLGFVAFYAIGAYSYALLNTGLGLGFWSALPVSMALSTLFGLLLAVPALRLKGDYLAIVTLGSGEMTRLALNNWDSLTNGPNGITGIARPHVAGIALGGIAEYYFLVIAFVAGAVIAIRRVYYSKTGRAWAAIRENEIAAGAAGVNVMAYKLYAFAFGALWAGIAGALYSSKMGFVSPESFTFMESVFILAMVILGGMGSIPGAVLGAVILVALPELLRGAEMYRMLALGAGLVLLMVFRPQGILGGKTGASA